ncbi:PilZ domain-containing protein [Pseudoduganella armeniaca]|uniref:PilZ domain-containing protein n=1 Tax=Pseudoduganella armeniaca TaxID=2072590 RepID=A0A2R4C9N8_9BURK|nr:PilZ domain-containing protein [Pseudoduganella armeniaca]AVR96349.1 PilZ domain-containing protein [Pseudoduganella armeniaca]
MSIDQRQSARKIMRTRAMVVLDGTAPMPARTFDISLGGVSVTTETKLNPGQAGQVVFEMLVDGKPQLITVRAKVVHCIFSGDEFKVGFMFQPLAPDVLATITRFLK